LKLKGVIDRYMQQVPEVRNYCERCLKSARWDGSAVLMVVDAAFTSIGLNYFQAVVPRVDKFRIKFVLPGKISTLNDLADIGADDLLEVWRNKRSWQMAKSVADHLAAIKRQSGVDDIQALRHWAKQASLEAWEDDPIGRIRGVGINSYQYLRMMGGIDTVMPDKIVKRVIAEILAQADMPMPATDIDFVRLVERLAPDVGYKAIEICWMTWMIQSEAGVSRTEKYSALLSRI
jgi:hypothetical protein